MSAVMTQRLVDLARDIERAPHGSKTQLCKAAAADLGITLATVYRKLQEVTVTPTRKRRADAGTSALERHEAELISAVMIQSIRDNDKQLSTLERAVERLRRLDGRCGAAARIGRAAGHLRPLLRDRPTRGTGQPGLRREPARARSGVGHPAAR